MRELCSLSEGEIGEHYRIGELYGFRLLVRTEDTLKEGLALKQNRFYVEGDGNVKYAYNNGFIANDPKMATEYFLHALEKIPLLIETYEKKNAGLSRDLPVLQEVVSSSWKKEDELKRLKAEAAALERKIELALKPLDDDGRKPDERRERQENTVQPPPAVSASLNDYRDAMGDRL
jgi:hypothetical protein